MVPLIVKRRATNLAGYSAGTRITDVISGVVILLRKTDGVLLADYPWRYLRRDADNAIAGCMQVTAPLSYKHNEGNNNAGVASMTLKAN